MHPFVAYVRRNDEENVIAKSFCVTSDCTRHKTETAYNSQKEMVKILKKDYDTLNIIHYFSDVSAAKHKNKYNFRNICLHQDDFQLNCIWNFCTTCHGKCMYV